MSNNSSFVGTKIERKLNRKHAKLFGYGINTTFTQFKAKGEMETYYCTCMNAS